MEWESLIFSFPTLTALKLLTRYQLPLARFCSLPVSQSLSAPRKNVTKDCGGGSKFTAHVDNRQYKTISFCCICAPQTFFQFSRLSLFQLFANNAFFYLKGFRIKDVGTGNNKRKCIEFRNKYALKVVNSTHVAFEGSQMNVVSSYQF